jgi:hypothetical protein
MALKAGIMNKNDPIPAQNGHGLLLKQDRHASDQTSCWFLMPGRAALARALGPGLTRRA